VVYRNGIIDSIYEVVYKNPLNGRKLGLIQYWCYRNNTELVVYEISADYILKQTEKPKEIKYLERNRHFNTGSDNRKSGKSRTFES